MKTRQVLIALLGVILLVILGFSLLFNKSFKVVATTGVKENPQGVVFVPQQSPLMVSLLVNPQQLESFTQLLPINNQSKRVMKAMDKLRATLLTQAQVDSLDDLKRWIDDEVTFAVTSLDYDHNRDNGTQPGYLLAVKNNNSESASEFLQTYYSKNVIAGNSELIFDEYQGVKIVYQRPLLGNSPVKQLAAAVVGDFVLFANDLIVLTDAINNAQAVELNLEHDLAYQNSLASLPAKKIGVVYTNLPMTSAWITNQAEIEEDAQNQSFTVSLQLNKQGLLTHTALFTGVDETKQPTLSQVPQTVAYVPEDSIFTIAGANLQLLAENIQAGLAKHNPFAEILTQIINPLESGLELDFDQEIFQKVTGEYALSLSPNQENQSLDWFFVKQIGDEPLSPSFDLLAQSRGLSIGNLPLDNQSEALALHDHSMTTWTKLVTTSDNSFSRLQAEVKGVHSQISSYEIITSSVNLLSNSFNESSNHLLDSTSFRSSLEILPNKNNGYLYLRWQPLKPYLVKRFPLLRVVELGFKPLFDNLYSITVTNEGINNGIQMSTVFFDFGGSHN